jgi:hypothetical protein
MVTNIKRGATKEEIRALFERINESKSAKGFDAYKYCGKIKFKEDGLKIQKTLRDEWK